MTQQRDTGEYYKPLDDGDFAPSSTAMYKVVKELDHGARGITLKVKVEQVFNENWCFGQALKVGDCAVLKCPTFDTVRFDDSEIQSFINRGANPEINEEISALSRLVGIRGVAKIYDLLGVPVRFRTITGLLSCLIEEFIEGQNLKDYLTEKYGQQAGGFVGIPDATQFLELAEKITCIVSTVHQNLVLHLDIWPPNIMIRNEEPVLIDFGGAFFRDYDFALARQWERQSTRYMAPERTSKSVRRLGRRADVYSLGGVFFYMATGEDPPQASFDIDFVKKTVEDRINRNNPQLISENPLITDIIARCLRGNKDLRTRDATTLLDEIRTARDAMTRGSLTQFGDTLEKLRHQGIELINREEAFFHKVFHLELEQLANKLDDVMSGAIDISGNHDELVGCLCKYLSVLEKDDLFIDFTVPWFWFTNNAGINGRFLSMNKLLTRKGVIVSRLFMTCNEDTTVPEIQEVIEAHVRATREIDIVSLSTMFIHVDSLVRAEKLREGWHRSVIVKKGNKPILAVPVYDEKKNLRTIRFLSSQRSLDSFVNLFDEEKKGAVPIKEWPPNRT